MYAVVKVAGFQVRVQEGDRVQVPRLSAEPGSQVQLSDVLLVSNQGQASIGSPTVAGASVEARVASHGLGDKVTVFKMKRRKNYRRKRGHRQPFTELEIQKIVM
ncbi:50S ribosomal protein L21 [bacterium]|nr:50S ribosomal protein L21 [bacterium]